MHASTLAHMHAHLPTHTREHTRTLSPLMSLLNTLSANTSSSFSLSSHCSALARWHDFDFGLSLKFQTNSAEAIDSNLNINRLTQFWSTVRMQNLISSLRVRPRVLGWEKSWVKIIFFSIRLNLLIKNCPHRFYTAQFWSIILFHNSITLQ